MNGALDSATKQLDQVIDQARHKHSQHRNKFKEAIDYLDQIFEDLKKEVDPGVEDKIKDRSVAAAAPQHSTVTSPPDNIRFINNWHNISATSSAPSEKHDDISCSSL
ncbi:hypothetical protein ANCCEY_04486 [Ancylostoma ceylanicum]|uniref:Uncharacterized protein n=1 Tax=Ancylostoma ceylanicum TaxID=53326 RepID=A0A0D6LYZ4_9BILA|nr:hypothetical protein ANCCEY_04486 [Ancylostoma ceylanicum]